eukprot:COSAG02_NODE_1694_length_11277_cov_36.084855_3_plen_202_part_00
MPRSASRPSSKRKTSRSNSALKLRSKGMMKKAKKKAVSIGSAGMDTANVGSHVHGRTQSLSKLAQRRASLLKDPKQNVRRSVSGGSAADEMAAAVAAMDMEERAEREQEMKVAAMPPPPTTELTEGERTFVQVMAAKYGDGTGGGFKKMAKDTEINVTKVSASMIKRLFGRYRKNHGQRSWINDWDRRCRQRPAEMIIKSS